MVNCSVAFNGAHRDDRMPHEGRGCMPLCHFRNLYTTGNASDTRLVAHVVRSLDPGFPADTLTLLREYGLKGEMIKLEYHASIEAFHASVTHAARQTWQMGGHGAANHSQHPLHGIQRHKGLTVATNFFNGLNIGHSLYDVLFPNFVSMIELGLDAAEFRVLMLHPSWGTSWSSDKAPVIPERARSHAEILGIFGGWGVTWVTDMPGQVHRYDEVVLGFGATKDELDMNVNFTLAPGRWRDAPRRFRARMYSKFGLEAPEVRRRSSAEGRVAGGNLSAIIISASHYGLSGAEATGAVQIAAENGVTATHIRCRHRLVRALRPHAKPHPSAPGLGAPHAVAAGWRDRAADGNFRLVILDPDAPSRHPANLWLVWACIAN